jgi:hypothetical protein
VPASLDRHARSSPTAVARPRSVSDHLVPEDLDRHGDATVSPFSGRDRGPEGAGGTTVRKVDELTTLWPFASFAVTSTV